MRSPSSNWSFLRDSPELRGALKYRFEQQDKTLVQISKELNFDATRLSRYFRNVKPNLTNWQLVKLANYLGFEVQLDIKSTLTSPPAA